VYGRPADSSDLPLAASEAVLADRQSYSGKAGSVWFISTTADGDAALASTG
jgi:hypothetical protein